MSWLKKGSGENIGVNPVFLQGGESLPLDPRSVYHYKSPEEVLLLTLHARRRAGLSSSVRRFSLICNDTSLYGTLLMALYSCCAFAFVFKLKAGLSTSKKIGTVFIAVLA